MMINLMSTYKRFKDMLCLMNYLLLNKLEKIAAVLSYALSYGTQFLQSFN